MSDEYQNPSLDRLYQQYLHSEKSADFVRSVADQYTLGTLEKLAKYGQRVTRRGAVLAIGFLGDYRCNEVLGHALRDNDRAVRMLADHGIRTLWFRVEDQAFSTRLNEIYLLNQRQRHIEAMQDSDALLAIDETIAEAWNQRAVANYALGNWFESRADCWKTLELNPFHFSAALGMGHCSMQMDDVADAIDSFQTALEINPDLENVRAQIEHLQRSLDS